MVPLLVALAVAASPRVSAPEWFVPGVEQPESTKWNQRLYEALSAQGLDLTSDDALIAKLEVQLERLPTGAFHGTAKLLSVPDGKLISSTTLDAKDEPTLLEVLDTAASMLAAPLVDKPELPPERRPHKVAVTPYWWVVAISGVVVGGTGAGLLGAALRDAGALQNATSVFDAASRTQGPLFVTGWVGVGAGVAAVLTSLVLAAPLRDYRPTVAFVPGGASVGLAGSF